MDARFEETVREMREKLVALEGLVDSMLESSRELRHEVGALERGGAETGSRSRGPDDDGFYCDTYV